MVGGGSVCSVTCCTNTTRNIKKKGINVKFHAFPKDKIIRKQWIVKCRRKDKFNPDTARVCSAHFADEDFEDQLKASLLGIKPWILKKDAVPSLQLRPSSSSDTNCRRSSKYLEIKARKEIIKELLEENSEPSIAELSTTVPSTVEPPIAENSSQIYSDRIQRLEEEKHHLEARIKFLEKRNEALEVKNAKNELGRQKKEKEQLESQIKQLFRSFLTPNQIDILLKKKSKARWTSEELSKAFTLRYLSQKSYIYVKNSLKYPLPGLSTLRKWALKISLKKRIKLLNNFFNKVNNTSKRAIHKECDANTNRVKKIRKVIN